MFISTEQGNSCKAMDATQMISDSILESDEEENDNEENENKRGRPLAKLCILRNEHIPQRELPLFLGDNVLGRDPNTCTLPLSASSVSKRHATICISVYRRRGCHREVDVEALVWDLGSMNGTRKGRLKLTPNVRYALSEGDSLVVADIPCQYFSCNVDSSQGDKWTPVSRNSGVKAKLPDASREKEGDSKKCVNGGAENKGSLKKTPAKASCLSFEQTPTQPQGTLVPESDSDSGSEKWGAGDRRRKALASDSDSHKSSPTSSTFLSPTNKIVPESEDESSVTPASSAKNRPYQGFNFRTKEADVNVERQQPNTKTALAVVDDSEEEEERAAQGGIKSKESGQHVPVEQESTVRLTREDELPASTPVAFKDAIPVLSMDSDTDLEGEEEGVVSSEPVTLNTNQKYDQPPNIVQFHMDSDTEEDEDVSGKTSSNEKSASVVSVIQPEAITMDSDTDVDDADTAVSEACSKTKPTPPADSASSMQLNDFHLDSDTDVDDEEKGECGTTNTNSETDETPNKLDIQPTVPQSVPTAPQNFHLDSDTDDEAIPAPAINKLPVVAPPCNNAIAAADLHILSDSDTDVEGDSPLIKPAAGTSLSVSPRPEAFHSDSDAATDVDESIMPPAGDAANPAHPKVDSDTDMDDKKGGGGEAGEEGQIPALQREFTSGLLAPLLQNCSTPVQFQEGEVEGMETQAFISPSSDAFRCAGARAVRPAVLSSCSESQEDEDFVVAETQSFVLQTRDRMSSMEPTQAFVFDSSGDKKDEQSCRGESFQLGLSDSSHLQCQDQALAMESTQAFISVGRSVNPEDTQVYPAIIAADRTSVGNDSSPEATQPYGENEEPARCAVVPERVDRALEATQAYISEPLSDQEDNTDEDDRQNAATTETGTSSTLAMAETQQMCTSFNRESDDDDSFPGPRKRTAKPLKLEEEQTQPLACSIEIQPMHVGVNETQPMAVSEEDDSDDSDLVPGPRKRKSKQLHLEEEQTQPLACSVETQAMHVGVDETQPMAVSEEDDSDDSDLVRGPRKRKSKQLHLEEEQTPQFSNSEMSVAETQPMFTREDDDDDDDDGDSMPCIRNRKAKQLHFEDEQTQPLSSSEVSAVDHEESEDHDSSPGPGEKTAKQLQPAGEETALQPRKRKGRSFATFTEEEGSTVPPKRQTQEESETLPSTRGRRRRAKPDDDDDDDDNDNSEQDVKQTKRRTLKQQKEYGEEDQKNERTEKEWRETDERKVKQEEIEAQCRREEEYLERERKQKELERLQAENAERMRLEEERLERERKAQELLETAKREQEEKLKRERMEKEERERQEREKLEEKQRLEREEKERLEREEKEREEKQRLEREKKERLEREEKERLEREEKQRLEREKKERLEREEKERLEREEKQRLEREEKERLEREEEERLEREERERLEREEEKKLEMERKEKEEKEHLEMAKRQQEERLEKEREEKERLEREAKEREEREKLEKEKEAQKKEQENKEEENKPKVPARGRRTNRRTIAAQCAPEPDSTNDDFPARRTRSRSNSSNSVSSERSVSSVNTQESTGRGRGRGAKRTSAPPQTTATRSSRRRTSVAAGPAEQDRDDISPLSRSNSSNSLNSEISSCSVSSQSRGRGGRQRGRGRKTEPNPDSVPPQSDPAPKPVRSTKSRKTEGSSSEALQKDERDKPDSQQASTTRGRRQANASGSVPAEEEDHLKQGDGCASEESFVPKKNVRGKGQKQISDTMEEPVVGESPRDKRRGRKGEFQANTEAQSSGNSNISKGKEETPKTEPGQEERKDETKDDCPATVQAHRQGRPSGIQVKKNAKKSPSQVELKQSEKMEVELTEKRASRRPSVAPKKKTKDELEDSGTPTTSMNQDVNVQESQLPQTPTGSASRKRQAPAESLPVAKSPRSSSASPATSGRLRAASQTHKVLFTGVVDEAGERVLTRLGGSMAKDVADMNCLVTDKVRRTVKFLCAVAKGVPIVTTDWLEKSGKAGSFLSPNAFLVKDPEQEGKFNFCLLESLRIASSQPLLQGYEIHVTKSVKPEPVQMKDIISCSGATFLPKMPSSHKPQTVVISCEEDWLQCGPAISASLPVVTAEFILTGILQQKIDFQTHKLSPPVAKLQPAAGRGRSRKKT